MQVPGATGLQIGGGIAGFASRYEAPSIKVYNERQKYHEWEFIYDVKNDKRLQQGVPAQGMQNPLGGKNPTTSGPNQSPNASPNQTPMQVPNPITSPIKPPTGRR